MKCNTIRLHSAHGEKPPAPETIEPFSQNSLTGTQKMGGSLTLELVQWSGGSPVA
jgi:hypothetical protein